MKKILQSIIMPYHRNKQMLLYTTELLNKIIPKEVEIIIVGKSVTNNVFYGFCQIGLHT